MKKINTLPSEIYAIELEQDRYIIYAPLNRSAFIGNRSLAQVLSNAAESGEDIDDYLDNNMVDFLTKIGILNGLEAKEPDDEFIGNPTPTTITLFLTNQCNLRCTYCYASAGDYPIESMDLSIATSGIDFIINNAISIGKDSISVYFHGGGEPTVNWSTLTSAYNYAKEKSEAKGIKLFTYMATNGIFSATKRDWIVKNMNGCSISFDGLPKIQDQYRITVGGKPSSAIAIQTMRDFDASDFNYGIRVTVTKDKLSDLSESIEYICQNFSSNQIQVEPAYRLGRWQEEQSSETIDFIEHYREAKSIAKLYGRNLQFSAARFGLITNHFCGVTQDSFSLTPKGNVSSCYEIFSEKQSLASTFIYGSETEHGNYEFDFQRLDFLRGQTVKKRSFCEGCFAKWHCAGDCYHKSLAETGQAEFSGSDRCHIIRELTKDQILDAIQESSGVFWHPAI